MKKIVLFVMTLMLAVTSWAQTGEMVTPPDGFCPEGGAHH
jgi:hypothetical protein